LLCCNKTHEISGFRRDGDEISALLSFYAARSFNSLPTFRETCGSNLQGSRLETESFLSWILVPLQWNRKEVPKRR